MTVKEYLSQYKNLCTQIDIKKEQAEQLRDKAVSVSNMSGSGGGNSRSDSLGKTVARLVDAEREIRAMIDRLVILKTDIENTIETVEDIKLRQILILRYINGHTFERIAEDMGYSVRQVLRKHKTALKFLKNVIECHYDNVI